MEDAEINRTTKISCYQYNMLVNYLFSNFNGNVVRGQATYDGGKPMPEMWIH
jgi:hypothetical protein